jgi:hypothetical protein
MSMNTRRGKPRDPVKEQFWRRTISDQAQSDLPIQTYCRRKGLNPQSFRSWRQELARRGAEVASAQPGGRPHPKSDPPAASAFLPVRLVHDAPKSMTTASPIEIVLPAGPTVRVMRGFDPLALDAVLSVLETRRC